MVRSFLRCAALAAFLAGVLFTAAPAFAKLDDKTWNEAKKGLEQAMAAGNADAVVKAIDEVAKDGTRRGAELVILAGISDKLPAPRVYEAILAALGTMTEPDVQTYLIEVLDKKTEVKLWPQRCVVCDALAAREGPEVTRALGGRLKDNVPYVISSAAKALGKRLDKAGVEPLIKALGDFEKKKDVVWLDVRGALTAICGFDFETQSEWDAFWVSKKDTFDPAKDRGEKTTTSTTVLRDEAKFFTEVIVSKRIMFVIDISGSMREKDIPIEEGGTTGRTEKELQARIDVVKKALIACIKDLKPDVKFNIIAFSDGFRSWRPSKQGLQAAETSAKQDAMKWVDALNADGATETDVALEESFANIDVNTIVLLSDGAPTRGRGGPGGGGTGGGGPGGQPGGGGPGGQPGGGGPGGQPGGGVGGGGQGGGGQPGGGGAGGGRGRGGRGRGGFGGNEIDPQEILDKVKLLNRLRNVKIHTFCFKVFETFGGGGGGRMGGGFDPAKCIQFLRDLAEQNGGKLTLV